ncbi:hypothetical protein pb186bvf_004773 [Paramecium bursaria]
MLEQVFIFFSINQSKNFNKGRCVQEKLKEALSYSHNQDYNSIYDMVKATAKIKKNTKDLLIYLHKNGKRDEISQT